MAYIGNIPAEKYQTLQKQSFTTSATDTYTLSYSVTNPQDLALFINNVRQNPNDAYTVSGTTLTLSSAITSSDTMYAVFLGRAVETIAPATGSVTNSMLAGSIDQSKLAGSIPTSKISGSLGKISQLVSSSKFSSGSQTSTSTTYVSTPVTANITPSATSSNILIAFTLTIYKTGGDGEIDVRILRDIGGSTTEVIETGALATSDSSDLYDTLCIVSNDAPSTTSQITYTVQFRRGAGSGTVGTNIGASKRAEITLMEVLA